MFSAALITREHIQLMRARLPAMLFTAGRTHKL